MTESAYPDDRQLAARDAVHAFVRRSLARHTVAPVRRDVARDAGLRRGWQGAGLEQLFHTSWREMALVRSFELWQQVSTLRLLRALAGAATLAPASAARSASSNSRATSGGGAGLWRPVDLAHIFPHVPRWPAEDIATARAYARGAATVRIPWPSGTAALAMLGREARRHKPQLVHSGRRPGWTGVIPGASLVAFRTFVL